MNSKLKRLLSNNEDTSFRFCKPHLETHPRVPQLSYQVEITEM